MRFSTWLISVGLFVRMAVTTSLPEMHDRNLVQKAYRIATKTANIGVNESDSRNFTYCDTRPKFRLMSLMTYMMRLKLCEIAGNKDWFKQECRERTYALTDYYQMVYLNFCDGKAYAEVCNQSYYGNDESDVIVRKWLEYNMFTEIDEANRSLASLMNTTAAPRGAINQHPSCRQINSYFKSLGQAYIDMDMTSADPYNEQWNKTLDIAKPFTNSNYSEWLLMYRPFCEPVACGTSLSDYQTMPLSSYSCFPASCRPAMVFAMVLDAVLALAIIFSNSLVLSVAIRTQIMRNIHGYFKVQLAVADLLVGLVILPGSIYQSYVLYFTPLPLRREGQAPRSIDYFSQEYLNFMGIITVLSFATSICTMGAAGVDRYLAVTRPFRYRKGKYLTKKRQAVLLLCIWMLCFVVALFPLFTSSNYDISALSLVLGTGNIAIAVYAVTLGVPLLAVWIINGLMLRQVCADGKKRRIMSAKHINLRGRLSSAASRQQENGKSRSNGYSNGMQRPTVTRAQSTPTGPPGAENNCATNTGKQRVVKRSKSEGRPNTLSKFANSIQSTFRKRFTTSQRSNSVNQDDVEKKLAKTLGIMVGAFTLALLPAIIVLGLIPALEIYITPLVFPKTYSATVMNAHTSCEFIAVRLLLSNSFWNCIIYSVRNRHFRYSVVDAFSCDEDAKRRRRRTISQMSSRGRQLKKMSSNDSGCMNTSSTDDRLRKSTEVFDISSVSRKDCDVTEKQHSRI